MRMKQINWRFILNFYLAKIIVIKLLDKPLNSSSKNILNL